MKSLEYNIDCSTLSIDIRMDKSLENKGKKHEIILNFAENSVIWGISGIIGPKEITCQQNTRPVILSSKLIFR